MAIRNSVIAYLFGYALVGFFAVGSFASITYAAAPAGAAAVTKETLQKKSCPAIFLETQTAAAPASLPALSNDRLRQLLVLEELFRNNSDGILDPNGPSVGNVAILNQLFRDSAWFYPQDPHHTGATSFVGRMTTLFAYKQVFQGSGNGLLSSGPAVTLGDLVILDKLLACSPAPNLRAATRQ